MLKVTEPILLLIKEQSGVNILHDHRQKRNPDNFIDLKFQVESITDRTSVAQLLFFHTN